MTGLCIHGASFLSRIGFAGGSVLINGTATATLLVYQGIQTSVHRELKANRIQLQHAQFNGGEVVSP
jgi:hypothetical protein